MSFALDAVGIYALIGVALTLIYFATGAIEAVPEIDGQQYTWRDHCRGFVLMVAIWPFVAFTVAHELVNGDE